VKGDEGVSIEGRSTEMEDTTMKTWKLGEGELVQVGGAAPAAAAGWRIEG
jgi:hypothetical protein